MSLIDVDIETFEQSVINASSVQPVAVAFEVSPALEKLAADFKFTIAKLDPQDPNNQQLAGYLQLRSIDDIRIFKDGQITGSISGGLSEEDLRKQIAPFFVSDEELELARAEDALNLGQVEIALKSFKKIIAKYPANKKAAYLLAKSQTLAGKTDDAKTTIQSIKENDDFFKEAQSLLELMNLNAETLKLVLEGKHREALDKFLSAIETSRNPNETSAAKSAMLTIFSVLGNKHELTWEYRAKLNRLLYI